MLSLSCAFARPQRHSDVSDPVSATADVLVEVWNADGTEVAEVLKFRVECEGYPGEEIDVLNVECYQAALAGHPAREPSDREKASLENEFTRMWENHGGLYRGERDEILDQLQAAIEFDSPSAQYERSRHAAAESIYGCSL